MTKGLPASGKSTWAKEYIKKHPNTKRINKDDLRAMLDNSRWSRENEKFILETRDSLIMSALVNGFNVIVDDTNLAPKHETALKEITNHMLTTFEIKDFTDVAPDVCIQRDLARPNSVGSKVIMDMYNQFLAPKTEKVEHDPNLEDAIICDVDGTLALFTDNPYDRDFSKDTLNKPVAEIVREFASKGIKIIIVSGRKNSAQKVTEEWLTKNDIPYNEIYMPRSDKDWRKDYLLKEEIYNEHIKGKNNIKFVLDDRNQVVSLWRRLGLTCFQVAEGDF